MKVISMGKVRACRASSLSNIVAYGHLIGALCSLSSATFGFYTSDQSVTLILGIDALSTVFLGENEEVEISPIIVYELGRLEFYPYGVLATLWEWQEAFPDEKPDISSAREIETYVDIELGIETREQGQ